MESTGYRVPTNRDINEKLSTAEQALEETKREQRYNLTREGKQIIDTTERLLEHTKEFVREKNPNDALRQIVIESQTFYDEIQSNSRKWYDLRRLLQNPQSKFDADALMKKMQSVGKTARLVAIELITSPTFRQTVWDFFSILYTILLDASNIKNIGRPLREVVENFNYGNTEAATEKLKEVGQEAVQTGLKLADPDKKTIELTDDQKRMLWLHFRDVLSELSKRERSQRMFQGILDIMELLYMPFRDMSSTVEKTSNQLWEDEHVQKILMLTQQLFEGFTRTSLNPIISHFKVLYRAIAEDERLRTQLYEFREWLVRVLENPELLTEDRTYDSFNRILYDLSETLQSKKELRLNLAQIQEEFNRMIWSMENDRITRYLQDDIKRLVEMVLLDERGNVTFKPEVLDQLRLIIMSAVVKRLRVPFPEINVDDPNSSFAFRMSGVIVGIQDLLPERIIAENRGLAILNIKDKEPEDTSLMGTTTSRAGDVTAVRPRETQHTVERAAEAVRIKMEKIRIHIRNADIWFHKRTFPEVEDTGKADVDIGGDGMDLSFVLKTDADPNRLFGLAAVQCDIHDLKLNLHETTHDTMYNMVITLFKSNIKSNIEEAIQESMVGMFENLNKQIAYQVQRLRENMPNLKPSTLLSSMH